MAYTYLPQRISKNYANLSIRIEESEEKSRCNGRYRTRLDDHPNDAHRWLGRWARFPGSGSLRQPPDTSYNHSCNGKLRG